MQEQEAIDISKLSLDQLKQVKINISIDMANLEIEKTNMFVILTAVNNLIVKKEEEAIATYDCPKLKQIELPKFTQ